MSLQPSRVMTDFCKTPLSGLPWRVNTEWYLKRAMLDKGSYAYV
jgi:hypothetical protein